jgi:hypothetical protein
VLELLSAAARFRMLCASTTVRHLNSDSTRAREKQKRNKMHTEPSAGGTCFREIHDRQIEDQRGRTTNVKMHVCMLQHTGNFIVPSVRTVKDSKMAR